MNLQEMDRVELRFGGTGGQGLVLASIILANALAAEGYNVIQGESHGIEARGGASRGELIASKGEIYDTNVAQPDVFVAISQEACSKYYKQIKKDALVIIDSFMVKDIPDDIDSGNVFAFPFTQKAQEELNTTLPTNIVFLGALTELSGLIDPEAMKESILERVPKGTEEVNTRAFELGVELATDAKPIV